MAYSAFTIGAYNDFVLTNTSTISLTGTTTLGFRLTHDTASTSPNWIQSQSSLVYWNTDNNSQPPLLTIEYHVPTSVSLSTSLINTYTDRFGNALGYITASLLFFAFFFMIIKVFRDVDKYLKNLV